MEQELMEKKKVFQVSTDLVLKNLQKRIDGLDKEISFFNLVSPSSMLKKVTSYIPPNDVFKITDISLIDYAIALYLSKLSYEEAQEKCQYLHEIKFALNNMDAQTLASSLRNKRKLSSVLEEQIRANYKELFDQEERGKDMDSVLEIITSNDFLSSCQQLFSLVKLQDEIENARQVAKKNKFNKDDYKKMQQQIYESVQKAGFLNDFERITSKCSEWQQKEKKEKSALQKERVTLSNILDQIHYHTFEGITEKDEQFLSELDIVILYTYLTIQKQFAIDQLNQQISELSYLEDEYKNEELLAQYHIDTSKMTEEERSAILEVSNDVFQKWMEELTNLNIAPSSLTPDGLRQILQYGNIETVPELQVAVTRSFASPTFIKEHPGVFVTDENEELKPLYETFVHNRDLLAQTNIDVHDESYQAEILLTNPADMESRLSLARLYQVDLSNTANMMKYLSGEVSFDTIDTMIESNLTSKEIEIGKLKMSQEEFERFQKRVAIAKQIGLFGTPSQGVSTNTLLTGAKFQVPTSELDEFTANATVYFLDTDMANVLKNSKRDHYPQWLPIHALKPYENGLTYQIGTTTLSAPKVKRNLQALSDAGYDGEDALFQSCIYNSILTLPQVEEIQNAIYPPKEKVKK